MYGDTAFCSKSIVLLHSQQGSTSLAVSFFFHSNKYVTIIVKHEAFPPFFILVFPKAPHYLVCPQHIFTPTSSSTNSRHCNLFAHLIFLIVCKRISAASLLFPPLIILLIRHAHSVPPFHLLATFFLATPESIPRLGESSASHILLWAVHHAISTSLTGPIHVPLRIARVCTARLAHAGTERPRVMHVTACLAGEK